MYRIGVVTVDPTGNRHSRELLAAVGRVADAVGIDPADISANVDSGAQEITLQGQPAESFDAVLLRTLNEEGCTNFQLDAYKCLERLVPLVVSRIGPLLTAQDKFRSTWLLASAGLPVPRSFVTQRLEEAARIVEKNGQMVAKPLYGSQGEDVQLLELSGELRQRLGALLAKHGAICLQHFIPSGGRDIRAFVVGDKVVGSIERVAQQGEWITNVQRGGEARSVNLPTDLQSMCVRAAKVIGLAYTGVDLAADSRGTWILEVNGTPSWSGVNQATGKDMANYIVDYVVKQLDRIYRRKAN